ncbi:phytanoyl-CoA dioxygenase family protein [Rhizobium sp. C4]|uniref:phytanoyl-CoA dioxygenase family protein n=1 Tax=Rhizobium sp. C4 TaxID=1349800 RepID=UPI001E2F5E00|nr:phytanoyl-CoA dioxygenase family protein [Rhizobium sp. C4]MCD2171679.1 phytanoyl-CoA dioxygenase family protein [Rhizobium sp. C4]
MEAARKLEPQSRRYGLTPNDCRLDEFRRLVERTANLADYPNASAIEKNVVIYDSAALGKAASADEEAVLAELCDLLMQGPGVAVFKRAFTDLAVIDRASRVFADIIDEQHRTKTGGGDHFAKPGANDRIWNSLEKHCLADPENFALYYANPIIELVSRAWLGPAYQMTAQVNRVNPGGASQTPHRDYHLGFLTAAQIGRYPAHVHQLSPVLTLQGAVAHCDMPLESGPTLFLPFSQAYEPGYVALERQEFKDYFAANHVQLPLEKGDVVFFNPALFHAAGSNISKDILRVANLLQVSSAFGRAMETVNRTRMCAELYPALVKLKGEGRLDAAGISNAIVASAESYSFPTNLDRDPPIGGIAPKPQSILMAEALSEGWTTERFEAALAAYDEKRQS